MGVEVEVVGDIVQCAIDGKRLWATSIDAIVLVAECTTQQGAWGEDAYIILRSSEEGRLSDFQIPDSVVGGFGVLIRALGPYFDAPLSFDLPLGTWGSRVVWPLELKDHRYFKLTPLPSRGVWEWVKYKCFGPSLDLGLTDEVTAYLDKLKAKAGGRSKGIEADCG